jgi:hypothetical protein
MTANERSHKKLIPIAIYNNTDMRKVTRTQFLFHVTVTYRVYFLKVFLPEPSGPTKNKNVRKMDPRTLDAFFEFQKYNLAPAENFGLQ